MTFAMNDNWPGMLILVLMLGMSHGLDPDHLATVDGLARANNSRHPKLAKRVGLLFSFGHGLVVILAASLIGMLAHTWKVPGWFESLGAWISITFLLALGMINLYAVLHAKPDEVVKMSGFKSRLFLSRTDRIRHPGWIVLTGALFALSFDTLSQIAFFAISAHVQHGWITPSLLGLVFMLGMMVTDGFNGYWVAHMLSSADRRTLIASRVMGFSVAGLSLTVGGWGLLRQLYPDWTWLTYASPLQQGIAVIVFVMLSFVLALRISPQRVSTPT